MISRKRLTAVVLTTNVKFGIRLVMIFIPLIYQRLADSKSRMQSHMYQEFCIHCIVIMNDGQEGWGGGWYRWAVVDSYQGVGGGTGVGINSHFFYLCFCLLFSHILSLFFK